MRTNFEFSHMCLHSLHPQALRSPPRVPTISYTKLENIHDLKCLFWYPEFCFSSDPFATILVPLERGDPRRHFELLHIKIHLCNNEISLIDFGCTEFLHKFTPDRIAAPSNNPVLFDCRSRHRSAPKFGRPASAQIEVWKTKYHGIFAVGGLRNRYVRAMMISDAS